jgi:hypothetical protein
MPFTAAGRLPSVAHVPDEHAVSVVPLVEAARTGPAVAEVTG